VTPRTTASRPSLVSVGTIIWLSSELMFFAGLFAMYFTIRAVDKGLGQHWPMAHLDLPLATTNTIVLLLSSVTWSAARSAGAPRYSTWPSGDCASGTCCRS
jgi:cytochrome c oxidase subunit 3